MLISEHSLYMDVHFFFRMIVRRLERRRKTMGMEDFFASLPTGKSDAPLLFGMGPLVYDFHDVDGLYYMLDHRLGGCLILMWSKPMNASVTGKVSVDEKIVEGSILLSMPQMQGMWILAVPLRGIVTEYGKSYKLHVEGYQDVDGNNMNAQDFEVTAGEQRLPQKKYAQHEKIALQAAAEGIVLLENKENVLPLHEGMSINLFGSAVHQFRNGAVGAGKITPRYSVNLIEAIRQSGQFYLNEELVEFYSCGKDAVPPAEVLLNAKEKSDYAFMMISRAAGENQDATTEKGEYYLTDEEEMLLQCLSVSFEKVIVILNVGYPISMEFVDKYHIKGLVYCGFGGMLGGQALLDVLTGKENPSGKLPDTWALDYFDHPSSKNFYDANGKARLNADCSEYVDTVYEEGIYVGYRYFESFQKPVAYPFGYGQSYTEFIIEPHNILFDGSFLKMQVHVKNIGEIPGKEVVQLYIGKPENGIEMPQKELVGFEKTKLLEPGEIQDFEIMVPVEHMTFYDEKKAAYVLGAGNYTVYAGNSVKAAECGQFVVEKNQIIRQVKNRMVPLQDMEVMSKWKNIMPKGEKSGIIEGKKSFAPYQKREKFTASFKGKGSENLTFADVKKDLSLVNDYVAQMSVEELARLSVGASAGWGMEGVGEACSMAQMEGFDIPRFPVADGNSGVNLRIANIGMPSSVTIAATFNKKLAEDVGNVIGEEAKELGIPLILAPAMNIHRNPLNGRQPEYFSEDPYQAGMMAGAYMQGLEHAGVGACMKHLIGNNCESARKRNTSLIPERAIREIYFRAFAYAMEVHMPASVMTGYNAVNGTPTAADTELILGLLREECGFDGFVMTDWTSYDTVDVAAMVEAGNCWITPGSLDDTYTGQIVEGVKNKTISLERLQCNVASMIRTMARFS